MLVYLLIYKKLKEKSTHNKIYQEDALRNLSFIFHLKKKDIKIILREMEGLKLIEFDGIKKPLIIIREVDIDKEIRKVKRNTL